VLGNASSGPPATGRQTSEQVTTDAVSKKLNQFRQAAEQRGFATLEELAKVLPEAEEDIGLLDELFNFFETHGIQYFLTEKEAEEAQLEPKTPESEEELEDVSLGNIPADDTISLYLREMAREPLLSREEEVELAQRIEHGQEATESYTGEKHGPVEQRELEKHIEAAEAARARFIRANTRLVVSIAKKYVNHGVPFLDLIQEGNLGLMRAVEKFDHQRGHRFSTYATWWIRQAISRALADQGRTIRIPIHMSDRIRKIRDIAQRLEKRWGRRPTIEEIAELMEIPPHEVRWMLSSSQQPISLEQPVGEEQDNELGYLIEDEELTAPPEAAAQMLLAEEMDKVLSTLDPREERILRLRYGLQDGRNYTLEEVGERFGLTRERIRQIEGQALRKLRHPRRSRFLRDYLA
jgi:RNA polymerase primary sigma factor